MKRGLSIENSGLCSICGNVVESTGYLLLLCDQMWKIWNFILCRECLMVLSKTDPRADFSMAVSKNQFRFSALGVGLVRRFLVYLACSK